MRAHRVNLPLLFLLRGRLEVHGGRNILDIDRTIFQKSSSLRLSPVLRGSSSWLDPSVRPSSKLSFPLPSSI